MPGVVRSSLASLSSCLLGWLGSVSGSHATVGSRWTVPAEVTGPLARALHLHLKEADNQRATRSRPENLEAVDYARKAWAEIWNKPQTKETNAQALAYLEKARALDPTVPEIWTNLAYAHQNAAFFGWSPSREESLRLAREAAVRAVALDP